MSGIVIGTTAAALTTVATAVIATVPEISQAFAPMFESSHEFAVVSASLLTSLPVLAMLTALVASGRD